MTFEIFKERLNRAVKNGVIGRDVLENAAEEYLSEEKGFPFVFTDILPLLGLTVPFDDLLAFVINSFSKATPEGLDEIFESLTSGDDGLL